MQRETQRNKLLTRRAVLLGGGQVLLVTALAGRLYQLQIVDKDRYAVLADENRINLRLLAPPRGRILDRFGVVLAGNHLNYRAVIVPEQVRDLEATLAALGTVIEVGEADRRRVLRDARRKHSFVPLAVRGNLSWAEVARVEVAAPELPGVSVEQGLTRYYPFGTATAHVLGYVAAVSEKELTGEPLLELPDFRIGKSGVEKSQDLELRGSAGTSQVEVNAYGRVVREVARSEGQPGSDVVLGLDMTMQEFVTRRCASEASVSCVLLDALTGDVLALVSSPSFDPSQFSTGLTPAMWQELSTDPRNPLSNKAIGGMYPPGSTFKPVVALAGLDAGAITPDSPITCPGYLELGDATFHCWRQGGHGTLHLRDAIKKSCDVFFYETSRRLGIDRIAAMAHRLGFGNQLGLDIPGERGGVIPNRDLKFVTTGLNWQQGETLIAGIGQGSVLATPLQVATMAARLVTGRAVVPHLVRRNGTLAPGGDRGPSPFSPLGLNPRALSLVLDGMNAVVNEQGGTAYAARITEPGLAMGGKSGTSQVRRITEYEREHGLRKLDEIPWKERDHALFVAFAPVGAPRYVCAAVVEHGGESGGGGSAVAAPICRDVLREVQRRDPARRVPDPEKIAQLISPELPLPAPAPIPLAHGG
ncbi:MAG: penicillin-binding protein 2 [Alphaproteobacteria bacterium]|nr:penicillin-binding protein 2 [Alphaproteobacteria bacterium]